jgi:hypothetical protein
MILRALYYVLVGCYNVSVMKLQVGSVLKVIVVGCMIGMSSTLEEEFTARATCEEMVPNLSTNN